MKRRTKRLLIALAVAGVLGIGATVLVFVGRKEGPQYVTETAAREHLVQTVEATGEVESVDEVDLAFDLIGTIEEVLVEVGDEVEKGQVLARLEADEFRADVERARRNVDAAQANLAQRRAGSTNEQIDVARAAVQRAEAARMAAEIALATAASRGDAAIEEARIAANTAEDDYQNVLAKNEDTLAEARGDLVVQLRAAMIEARSGLSAADSILGVDNVFGNDEFDSVLGGLNSTLKRDAENAYKAARGPVRDAENRVFGLGSSPSSWDVDEAVGMAENALSQVANTLLLTRRTLDATPEFTDASVTLSSLKSSIDASRVSLQSVESGLDMEIQDRETARVNAKAAEDSARNARDVAKQTLARVSADEEGRISDAETTVLIREAELAEARARLSEAEAPPRPIDLAALSADVERAEAELDAAKARLEKSEIRSPIDGKVTRVDAETGEQVLEAGKVVTVQTITDEFIVATDVSESDISKVSVGDQADIAFDAFGSDVRATGHVSEIDPAEKVIEGVVFFEVTVSIDPETQPEGIKPGMSTDVTILTDERPDVLAIPQRAVLQRADARYVRLLEDGEVVERDVRVGVRGDSGRVEILSGVQPGDEIILRIIEPE